MGHGLAIYCYGRVIFTSLFYSEFVRPSYGKGNTWGVVKTSYAGVGHAVGMVEESGRGSISRSHRHYGTGCVN